MEERAFRPRGFFPVIRIRRFIQRQRVRDVSFIGAHNEYSPEFKPLQAMQRRASDAGRVRVIRNVSRNLQRLDAALRERALIIVKQTVRSGSDDDRGEREVAFRIDQVIQLTSSVNSFPT